MGRGTWYYSLCVSSIVDASVRSEFEISSWRGARIGVRTYLLDGAIDGGEANGIIRDPNTRSNADLRRLVSFDVFGKARIVGRIAEAARQRFIRLVTHGGKRLYCLMRRKLWEASVLLGRKKGRAMDTLKFTAMPFGLTNAPAASMELMSRGGVRVAREDDRGVTEGREDVREVFQQRRSGAKRKLSRCGRNQLGNEPILALPEGADDFIVYYDAQSKDLEACLEKKGEGDCFEFDFEAKYHLGKANVDVVPWSRKKE
ncbi:hypothetical protein Tco_0003067 [Tanacetum coccineum]